MIGESLAIFRIDFVATFWSGQSIDRMMMEGLGVDNIRDVIAFPKNQQAQEPMTDAPAPVDPAQLRELGLALIEPPRRP